MHLWHSCSKRPIHVVGEACILGSPQADARHDRYTPVACYRKLIASLAFKHTFYCELPVFVLQCDRLELCTSKVLRRSLHDGTSCGYHRGGLCTRPTTSRRTAQQGHTCGIHVPEDAVDAIGKACVLGLPQADALHNRDTPVAFLFQKTR